MFSLLLIYFTTHFHYSTLFWAHFPSPQKENKNSSSGLKSARARAKEQHPDICLIIHHIQSSKNYLNNTIMLYEEVTFFLIFSSLFSYIGYLDNLSRKICKHIIKLQQISFFPPFYILHLLLESLKPIHHDNELWNSIHFLTLSSLTANNSPMLTFSLQDFKLLSSS